MTGYRLFYEMVFREAIRVEATCPGRRARRAVAYARKKLGTDDIEALVRVWVRLRRIKSS